MMEIETTRSIDMSNIINTAITNWSSDGRNQLYEEKFSWQIFIYFLFTSTQLYKQLIENDKNKFEAELGKYIRLFFME